jgi:hypothetical protein
MRFKLWFLSNSKGNRRMFMNKLETPNMFTEPEGYDTVCISG